MIKKITSSIIICLCAVLIFAVPVMADVCKQKGCTRKAVPGPNRNGYCYEHNPQNKAIKCRVSGCRNKAYHGSVYCSTHECCLTSCKNKKVSGLGVCSSHKKYQNSKPTASVKNNSTSKKPKYEMPDCDDYETFDDFMDDWEGRMPDGSDAEDYWENW